MNTQETLGSQQGQFVIDPEVRQRIANPKYPVRVPDKPVLHLSYRDKSYRPDHIKGRNKSFVGGLFGREWREKMEKKELKRELEEAAEEEKRMAEFQDLHDNICPTFMVWAVCYRGDRCPLRHPSYRYLERPPTKVVSPEQSSKQPKRDPNSYAAILEKRNSSEPEEFFNEALQLWKAETTTETNGITYSKALGNARQDRQTSKVPMTKASYEEAWPSLRSSVQGRDAKVHKQESTNVPHAWSTQKGPCILEEKPKTCADKQQTTNDGIIAQELQADEYAQMDYYPVDEFNEDSFYDQGQDTNEDVETSFDSHQNVETVELAEQFNSHSQSCAVIMDQCTGDTEEPSPPSVVSMLCDICMDRPKDATLVCGHRFCYVCALQMRLDERVCAICRRCIVSVIKTYN